MKRVLVVGDVMTDIIVQPDGPIARGSDRRAAIRTAAGGSAANLAVWLARFGTPITLVAKVGRADLTRWNDHFRAFDVTPHLCGDETMPTGTIVTLLDPDGERSFLTDRGANDCLDPHDLPDTLLDDVGVLHITAYSLVSERTRASVLRLTAAARARGIAVSVDPSSVSFLEEIGVENFFAWTAGASLCFPNGDEAAFLTGTTDEARQRSMLLRHYERIVIKRGARGAETAAAAGDLVALPAPLVHAIDTTGAGDAFAAAYLSGIAADLPVSDCLRRAISAGSRAAVTIGGQPKRETETLT